MSARAGDVIIVPAAGDVTVQGWVEKPGAYSISPGLTVLGAIAATVGVGIGGVTTGAVATGAGDLGSGLAGWITAVATGPVTGFATSAAGATNVVAGAVAVVAAPVSCGEKCAMTTLATTPTATA